MLLKECAIMYYPDLSPCSYFGQAEAHKLISIGWLDEEHPYLQGEVSEGFTDNLIELLVDPWAPLSIMGFADCPFCTESDFVTYNGKIIQTGNLNLFVPGEGYLYAAPSLIAHYILTHGYTPPSQFQQAVLSCPPMRSRAYFEAIVANGSPRFAAIVKKKYLNDG
jgi:hypothetical protein